MLNFFYLSCQVTWTQDEQPNVENYKSWASLWVTIQFQPSVSTSNLHILSIFSYLLMFVQLFSRVVTKISSCWVNTTSRRGIKQLGISFGSIFLLCSFESSSGKHSQQPGEIPGSRLLMTALFSYNMYVRFLTYMINIKFLGVLARLCSFALFNDYFLNKLPVSRPENKQI